MSHRPGRPQRVLLVAGTRPEAIKLAPLVRRLRSEPDQFDPVLCATAQHREMLDQVLRVFDLKPDVDLDLMRPDQSPNEVASRVLAALDPLLARIEPDWLIVQGDTTTAMASALAAFHRRVRIGHVEAGLRTGDLCRPFPEEANRRVVDLVSSAYFAPTQRAARALVAEGAPETTVHTTGNTIVDALLEIARRQGDEPETDSVLVTVHRRESFGPPLEGVLRAVERLARAFPRTRFLHVVHPNPNVLAAVRRNQGPPNLDLLEPLDYPGLVRLLRQSRLVLTDSGGIQEEAPTFGKPVLVLREKTERPEAVEAGRALLVGTDEERIVAEASRLLSDPAARRRMAEGPNPYGDGRAADRIAHALAGRSYSPFAPAAPAAANT
ncbi:MAG TPA: UDP-N-acetylglucosamine 2-epimerase (non-hydrolyzing) [Thermoanaerobaculia bacterium]|nr:UDP-N-acetylglucosamine 2-epimerase (non-hydrolyzing) [Thermoanaerobaculia bacterium]